MRLSWSKQTNKQTCDQKKIAHSQKPRSFDVGVFSFFNPPVMCPLQGQDGLPIPGCWHKVSVPLTSRPFCYYSYMLLKGQETTPFTLTTLLTGSGL